MPLAISGSLGASRIKYTAASTVSGKPALQARPDRPLLQASRFDAAGDLWIAGGEPDQIYRRVNGVWEAGIAGPSGQTAITDIAFDAAGDLWIAGSVPDQIYRRVNGVWEAGIAGPPGQIAITGIAFALTGSAPAFADNTGDAISGTVGDCDCQCGRA